MPLGTVFVSKAYVTVMSSTGTTLAKLLFASYSSILNLRASVDSIIVMLFFFETLISIPTAPSA